MKPKKPEDYQYWSKTTDRFDTANLYIVGARTQEAAQQWLENQPGSIHTALVI